MLQANFVMIYIIHKILVLLKITRILKRPLRSVTNFKKILKHLFFSLNTMMENPRPEKNNIIKDARNLFRLEKV